LEGRQQASVGLARGQLHRLAIVNSTMRVFMAANSTTDQQRHGALSRIVNSGELSTLVFTFSTPENSFLPNLQKTNCDTGREM
ncbi:MAG TPA: hypothetical protein VFE60_01250, partial [Roseiarcus sp.]|nr:hypothetical protein [Roseiarcus sp.]